MNVLQYKITYIALIIISFIVTTTRAYTRQRINKGLHTEDWLAIASCLILIVQVTLSVLFLERYTFLVETPPLELLRILHPRTHEYIKRTLQYQIGSHVGFLTALWLIKYSFLFFYKRLAEGRSLSKLWLFTFGFCTLSYIGNLIGYFFVCVPFSTYFDTTCRTQVVRSNASLYGTTATDILSDLLIMAIPLRLIRKLRMSVVQKLGLVFLFCLGIIVIVLSLVRTVRINAGGSGDYPESDPRWVALWSIAEETTAILVCCLPAIRKLFSAHRASRNSEEDPEVIITKRNRFSFRRWSRKYESKDSGASETQTESTGKLQSGLSTFPSPPVSPRKPELTLSRIYTARESVKSYDGRTIELPGVIPPLPRTQDTEFSLYPLQQLP